MCVRCLENTSQTQQQTNTFQHPSPRECTRNCGGTAPETNDMIAIAASDPETWEEADSNSVSIKNQRCPYVWQRNI